MKVFNPKIKRISRTYYWVAWTVCNLIVFVIAALLAKDYMDHDPFVMNLLYLFLFLAQFVYLSFLTVKRFHDVGRSTGYCLLCILLEPILIGDIMILCVVIKESDADNEWGLNEEKIKYERERDVYGR